MIDAFPAQETLEAGIRNARNLFGGVKYSYALTIWLMLGTTIGLAWIAWRLHYRNREPEDGRQHGGGRGAMAFLRFLFPKSVYLHRSTWVDIQLIVINQIFSPISLGVTALATGMIAAWTTEALAWLLPSHDPEFSWTFWPLLAFTLTIAMASDFATYVVHRLYHTVPALWEIHKVHHSAEVMSPLTIFRKHPLFDLAARILKAAFMGPMQGIVFFAFAGPIDAMVAFGANLVFGIFHMFGAGLRHSHVWLSYGPVVERVLISPAQHQIHHSTARRHWDKNFGQMFAIWDWAFGSLYVPKAYEELEFGVHGAPSTEFSGLTGGLIRPVVRACQVATGRRRGAKEMEAWRRRSGEAEVAAGAGSDQGGSEDGAAPQTG